MPTELCVTNPSGLPYAVHPRRVLGWFARIVFLTLCSTSTTMAESAVEGEYEGQGYAAQIFAMPDGAFHIVGWRHGLPGAAANAERIADGDGAKAGGEIHFKGNIWTATLGTGGELTGADDQGHHWTLQRIERASPTDGAKPPPGAIVLFGGNDASAWINGRVDGSRLLFGELESKQRFESFRLHLEFRLGTPKADKADGALVIGGFYELPLRDSFGRDPDAKACGAVRNVAEPLLNTSLPADTWQTLDIDFTAAEFDAQDHKTKNAILSAKLNGAVIHSNREIPGPTDETIPETPGPGPLLLRDAAGSIRFRNLWIVEQP